VEVELRHLRAFVAVAASRSFTRAAEQLFITQPALTRTIRQLESLLGAALIDRNTHPVSLTPAGEEFLPYASRILSDLEIGVGVIRKHANVSLGFSWLLPDPWAQHTVTQFESGTGNSVSLIRCDDPLAAVDEGQVDVALVRGVGQGTRPVRIVHLFDETRVAATRRSARYPSRSALVSASPCSGASSRPPARPGTFSMSSLQAKKLPNQCAGHRVSGVVIRAWMSPDSLLKGLAECPATRVPPRIR
jgi:DNA-binding transcriptional LysR family regulator